MVGYKVVSARLGDYWRTMPTPPRIFWPATSCGLESIPYEIGEITAQDPKKHGPLAVFDNLKHATIFANDGYQLTILRCEFELSEETELWCVKNGTRCTKALRYCPPGTVFARSVTPLEIVM
jgi:hypothetical protein